MNPDFEKYRPDRTAELMQLNVRIDPELKKQLDVLAAIENDTVAALVTEGVARVIEDRASNPEALEARRVLLLAEVKAIEAIQSAAKSHD